jgi:2-polyprenyl-6-methoxyphenol hydroxylase-like FAD-dependent oxidoreductase
MTAPQDPIVIVGGGIAGLTLAMHLHARRIDSVVYERVPELKELGVGITLLPHAMREFTALGVDKELEKLGIENRESAFFNRFGQLIYKEPRGRFAGYDVPEIGIHRGKLHLVLYRAALARLGADRIVTDRGCAGVEQDGDAVLVRLVETSTGRAMPPVRARAVIACDGVNSAVRKQFYPNEEVAFAGINTWRGVTRCKPIFDGRTYIRVGSIKTGKMVIYPIVDDIDAEGRQLINWTAEVEGIRPGRNDWNKPGKLEDFLHVYASWTFDWLDVAQMVRDSDFILEYPMVDRDPVDRWTFGRVTLAGDAAHPMYPRGSNGAAQATIDARVLADLIARHPHDPAAALKAYEAARLGPAYKVVRTNRESPPDVIIMKVEELVGDRPFDDLDRYVSQAELKALSDRYKGIAGFALEDLKGTKAVR